MEESRRSSRKEYCEGDGRKGVIYGGVGEERQRRG